MKVSAHRLYHSSIRKGSASVARELDQTQSRDHGQGLVEYMVMLALVLVLVIGTVQVIGAKAKNVFSQVANHLLQQQESHDHD